MKNLFTLIIGALLSSALFAQEVEFTGTYNLDISDQVRIRTGGTARTQGAGEWKKGSKVGNRDIPADTYAKMEEKLPKQYKLEIMKSGKGILKDAFLTNLTTGERYKGIYNTNTRDFLFAQGQGSQKNQNCGSFSLGVVKGKLSADRKKIENGEIGMGFVAGCKPVLISADATFFFSGALKP